MVIDELGTLHEHTARAAAGIIDTTLERLQDLDNGAYDTAGRIEFSCILTFHRSELLQTVFIDTTQHILLIASCQHLDIREEINDITKATLIKLRARIVAREHTFQFRVLALNGQQGIVDGFANLGGMSS